MKKLLKKIIYIIANNIKYFPIYEKLVVQNCQVGLYKKNIFSKFINIFFWSEYYHRSLPERITIQSKLMGGKVGAKWANKYNESRQSFPPLKGEKKVGNLDWHEASLGFQFVINLIKKTAKILA